MQRIAIIGNAGGGKSLLARYLSETLHLPLHVVDDVQWQPGWVRTPLEEIAAAHHQWLADSRWVIDGWGGWDLIEQRFEAADCIVVVDFPLHIHYRWALKRQVAVVLGVRKDWPPAGCKALPITLYLLKLMRRLHREMRPRLLSLAADSRFRDRLVLIHSPSELRAFRRRAAEAAK